MCKRGFFIIGGGNIATRFSKVLIEKRLLRMPLWIYELFMNSTPPIDIWRRGML